MQAPRSLPSLAFDARIFLPSNNRRQVLRSVSLSLSLSDFFSFLFESLLENLIYLNTLLSETETRCFASILGFRLYSQIVFLIIGYFY